MTLPAEHERRSSIRAPGGPEMLVPRGASGAGAAARAKSWSRSWPPASTGPTFASARAAIRRPRARPIFPASRSRARSRRSGAECRSAGSSATRSARSWSAAATRNIASLTKATRCRCRPALSMIEAAAIPETFFTCWQNMFMRAAFRPRRLGAGAWRHVRASAPPRSCWPRRSAPRSSPPRARRRNATAAKKLGADVAVNYKTEDFVAATKQATGGAGANLIVDIVGGDYVDRNYDAAADERRRSRRCRSSAVRRPPPISPI